MSDTTLALLIALPVLFASMTLHELMHAVAADWLGDPTARLMGRISVNPIRHIDPVLTILLPLLLILGGSPIVFGAAKPVQVNFSSLKYDEFGGAIVGMIGPLTNLAIAVVAALIFNLAGPTGELLYKILGFTIMINIGFFVFNSIPWPPLDGSRLLYAFAPRPLQKIMEQIESFGIAGLIIFILLFYSLIDPLSNVMISLIQFLAPGLDINALF
ncbi:MAG TPA: site-2 protease family protein [Candidatus Saccharimonadales bacterium]|nr:site-2 protease family protein [Candidatus Saccharimonadales bacterium]